MNTTMWRE